MGIIFIELKNYIFVQWIKLDKKNNSNLNMLSLPYNLSKILKINMSYKNGVGLNSVLKFSLQDITFNIFFSLFVSRNNPKLFLVKTILAFSVKLF